MAKPTAQYAAIAMPYTMKFMVAVWAAFLARVNAVSTMAKPNCISMTRNPSTRVHTKLIATPFAAAAAFAALASESADAVTAGAAVVAAAAAESGAACARSAVGAARAANNSKERDRGVMGQRFRR